MAETPVTCLLPKLASFIENELKLLRGCSEEILSLRAAFEQMSAFLRVADSIEETDEEVKVWVKQVRELAYDTEDALDELRLLRPCDHQPGFSSMLHWVSCVRKMKMQYRVHSEIRRINSRIKSVCDSHWKLRQKFSRSRYDASSSDRDGNWQDHRGNALLLDKTDLVGIEEPKQQLLQWLIEGVTEREVLSVAGMGGLGKTTLVKQVFEDPSVKKHFRVRAWLCLSRYPNLETLLRELLRQIMKVIRKPLPPGAPTMNCHWLKMFIKDTLRTRRYLIVLDDAWRTDEWDAIKYALPDNGCGSRVMITTRISDLASAAQTDFGGKVHEMEPLNDDQSWKLFCRKTFKGSSCPPDLEETCRYILNKCEGLPLAIVAISGVLATKDRQRIDEWDLVRRSLRSEIEENNRLQNLKKVLSLSLNDLPHYLRTCFLHLSVFPTSSLIERRRLIRIWVAEGFVERQEGKTEEEVAKEYFNELTSRNLLQVADNPCDGRFKWCRIHNLLREIITSKSSDQGFTTILKSQSDVWPDKARRLAVHNTVQTPQENRSLSQLRSLYVFGGDSSFNFSALASGVKLLGVLDLQAAPISRFPHQFVDCYYLTYISLRSTEVKTIPSSIGRLQNLQTLDLKDTNVTVLPHEILKLRNLRHLFVYRYELISYMSFKYGFKALLGIGALQHLQKLCYIEADEERNSALMEEIGKLTQLRRLGILKLRKEDGKDFCSAIAKLPNLRALSVGAIHEDEIIDLQHLTSPPRFLQRIYLGGRLESLPDWICSLQSLAKLHIRVTQLKKDPIMSLQSLPNLVQLELVQYDGKALCFKPKGFKKLRILGLDYFDELRLMEFEEGAMPCLEKLIIQRCKLLQKLPSGIEHLTKLKALEFFNMPEELVKKLTGDEEDQDYKKVAHIPEIYYGYWREGGWDVQSVERSVEGHNSPRPGPSMRSSELPPCWK